MYVIRQAFAKCIQKGATHIHLDFMLKLLPKLPEVRTKLDILTMTFLITHKLRNVGGPLLWEALGRGLLGLCLKMALLPLFHFFINSIKVVKMDKFAILSLIFWKTMYVP